MKLADLRKLSIKQKTRIHFTLAGGLECVITEHGLATVPALKGIPDFNLEQELASTSGFRLEPMSAAGLKSQAKPRFISRGELAAMTAASPAAVSEHDDQ